MREEYTEYKGRKSRRPQKSQKHSGYIKKFIKQTIFSIVIFSAVILPELLGLDNGQNIKEITKSALFYTIDTSAVTNVFKNIYPHKGETNAKETKSFKNI